MPAPPLFPHLPATDGRMFSSDTPCQWRGRPPFSTTVSRGDTTTIRAFGELDFATAALLTSELAKIRLAECTRCVLDLRALSFLDLSGVRLLMQIAAAAQADGCALLVVPPEGGTAARMLHLQQMHLMLTYISAPPESDGARPCTTPNGMDQFVPDGQVAVRHL